MAIRVPTSRMCRVQLARLMAGGAEPVPTLESLAACAFFPTSGSSGRAAQLNMRLWYLSLRFLISRSWSSFSFSRSLSRAALAKLAPPRVGASPLKAARIGLLGGPGIVGEGGRRGDFIAVGRSVLSALEDARLTSPLAKPAMLESRGEADSLRPIATEPPKAEPSVERCGLGSEPRGGVPAGLVEKYEGTYLARGGELEVVEDDLWSPTRIVIVESADMEAARGFVHSEEYEPVAALRHANADCTVIIVDGT